MTEPQGNDDNIGDQEFSEWRLGAMPWQQVRANTTRLRFDERHVGRVPDSIEALTEIDHLEGECSRYLSFPQTIANLDIWRFDFSATLLDFPLDAVSEWRNLRLFSAAGGLLGTVPPFFDSEHLGNINLCGNHLFEIPPGISALRGLQWLRLADNMLGPGLESAPSAVRQRALAEIVELEHLKVLDLDSNRLRELPPGLEGLGVETLSLEFNHIHRLPFEVGSLRELKELRLRRNQITEVPGFIKGCEKLETLDVRDNLITEIPGWVDELPSLHTVRWGGNPVAAI